MCRECSLPARICSGKPKIGRWKFTARKSRPVRLAISLVPLIANGERVVVFISCDCVTRHLTKGGRDGTSWHACIVLPTTELDCLFSAYHLLDHVLTFVVVFLPLVFIQQIGQPFIPPAAFPTLVHADLQVSTLRCAFSKINLPLDAPLFVRCSSFSHCKCFVAISLNLCALHMAGQ